MFGLTNLGLVHTAISLVALATGAIALIQDGRIGISNTVGRVYAATTVLTCLTGFGFFTMSSAVTKGQILGFVTVFTVAVALLAGRQAFGRASAAVETVAYSATFLFNMIPGVTQATTRLPPSQPIFADDAAQGLAVINGLLFLAFIAGAVLQVRRLRRAG